MNRTDFNRDIQDGTKTWEKVGNSGVPIYYLYYYLPKSNDLTPTDIEKWARNFIWNFKDGENSSEAAKQVVAVLKHFFLADTLDMLTFTCIPASTEEKNEERFEWFSKKVASECNMWNAYEHIWLSYDRDAAHLGGENNFDNIEFDEDFFDGKTVLLFDDIVTKGNSISQMVEALEEMGAKVIGAITLGRTVHHHHGTDPYDDQDLSIKKPPKIVNTYPNSSAWRGSEKVGESALESKRLYSHGYTVADIAEERELAESTIYGHLFTAGVLNPWSYITEAQFYKAQRIYEEGYESPSKELDKFLNVAGKAAFYAIRRSMTP